MTAILLAVLALAQAPEVSEAPKTPQLAVRLTVGEPSGVTVAQAVGDAFAIHLNAGFSTGEGRDPLVTFDVVYMFDHVIGPVFGVGWMKPWFGLGSRYPTADDGAGVRVPFGVSYYDRASPIEVFLSAAWGIVLIPETKASAEVTFGLRFGL